MKKKSSRDYPLSPTPAPSSDSTRKVDIREREKPLPISMEGEGLRLDKSIKGVNVSASKSLTDKGGSLSASTSIPTKRGGDVSLYADTQKNIRAQYTSPSGKSASVDYGRGGYNVSVGSPSASLSYGSDRTVRAGYYSKSGKFISGSYNLQSKTGEVSASVPITKKNKNK